MPRKPLNWVNSKTVGQVSEIAVLAPIKKGRVPGERRTYEERLRFAISNIANRVERGIPTQLDKVRTIHFGRMAIIRPEQYLVYSNVKGVYYYKERGAADGEDQEEEGAARQGEAGEGSQEEIEEGNEGAEGSGESRRIPVPIDDFLEQRKGGSFPAKPEFRSWLLTLVEFDGDLRVYFKDIAEFLRSDFDNVFQNCEDFESTRDFEKFWTWIRRYQIEMGLFYPRYPDLSVVRIKQLQDFKRRFDAFVAKVRSPTGRRVESMDELFDEFLRNSQQYASDFPTPGGTYKPGED